LGHARAEVVKLPFIPKRVLFEAKALEYERGQRIREYMIKHSVPWSVLKSSRVSSIPGEGREGFVNAKNTLVVGVRKPAKFSTCKPSAHFQLPLASSCPGMCEYCYLHTTLGAKPYPRVYVNVEEILEQAQQEIMSRLPETTVFEGAATSDPIPTEPYTGALKTAIEYFGRHLNGRFRFVTKFTDVETLLDANHRGHTRFRFSINADHVINAYEHRVPRLAQRIEAARKVAGAGYPLGFIIGPIMSFPAWQEEYGALISNLQSAVANCSDIRFELITHRYTTRAKNNIAEVFPESTLSMDDSLRQFKYGQFGYGKYVYPKSQMQELEAFFRERIERTFPAAVVDYFV